MAVPAAACGLLNRLNPNHESLEVGRLLMSGFQPARPGGTMMAVEAAMTPDSPMTCVSVGAQVPSPVAFTVPAMGSTAAARNVPASSEPAADVALETY